METAVFGRIPLSPNYISHIKPGNKNHFNKQWGSRNVMAVLIAGSGRGGGGLLDRPVVEKTTPSRESEIHLRKERKMSPSYSVMLHNDDYNRREYVVQVLMKVIPGMSLDKAVNIMQEAHHNGLSVVITCPQVDAEQHCMQLRGNGLLSSIEPAAGAC
ncbi:unnamed protein product [Cuscuta epithymum]|uniref:Adaptor protein ClpS core domain-containing protein n=1 Tax=Cuscuta epithymum TaxID=186058 RepID=A0AAV0G9J7_9ASTE|nr:unnamed protein product [Cuscuta epithymum]CAH9143899.1 unnamed protein product [Cuscuta epithymum]